MSERLDRRTARTRRALHEALIALILRKGYDAITVQQLIDEADVGRATFYAHYSGKDDLLRGGFKALVGELRSARRAAGAVRHREGLLAFSRAMFEHAGNYRQVYRALIGGRGSLIALNEIRRVLIELVNEELAPMQAAGMSRELSVQFVVGAFLTALTWWLEATPKLSAEQVDLMFRRLVLGGIRPLLRS